MIETTENGAFLLYALFGGMYRGRGKTEAPLALQLPPRKIVPPPPHPCTAFPAPPPLALPHGPS